MKKVLGILMMLAFLLCPLTAVADLIGTGPLDMDYSDPTQIMYFPSGGGAPGNYYANYDATYTLLGNTYDDEIFCVEDAAGSGSIQPYDFYTIDSSLSVYGLIPDKYIAATWLANWFYSGSQTDHRKAVAQVAIWEIILETVPIDLNLSGGTLMAGDSPIKTDAQILLYGEFTDAYRDNFLGDYADQWLLAVNQESGGKITEGDPFQNYLVPNPIPEPATMLMLGTGLIGLAGLGRKRFPKG